VECFIAVSTVTVGNLSKDKVKASYSYYFLLCLVIVLRGTMFKISRIPKYNYNLSPKVNPCIFVNWYILAIVKVLLLYLQILPFPYLFSKQK
jgi:hypothetical protein